jgi:hypothetical protein
MAFCRSLNLTECLLGENVSDFLHPLCRCRSVPAMCTGSMRMSVGIRGKHLTCEMESTWPQREEAMYCGLAGMCGSGYW